MISFEKYQNPPSPIPKGEIIGYRYDRDDLNITYTQYNPKYYIIQKKYCDDAKWLHKWQITCESNPYKKDYIYHNFSAFPTFVGKWRVHGCEIIKKLPKDQLEGTVMLSLANHLHQISIVSKIKGQSIKNIRTKILVYHKLFISIAKSIRIIHEI
jgi:hypothetical protein